MLLSFNSLNTYTYFCLFQIVPNPPNNLDLNTRTDETLTVTWTVPDSGKWTGHEVTVAEGENVQAVTTAKEATSVEITGLSGGTEYSVKLVKVNDEDETAGLTETYSMCEHRVYIATEFIFCWTKLMQGINQPVVDFGDTYCSCIQR